MEAIWPLTLLLAVNVFVAFAQSQNRPNIIFILADDLGWNDVSYHGMNEIYTPNIDTLAAAGVVLNNYYTLPVCTPSRSTILTGYYPIRTGLQHYVIPDATPHGLPINFTTLPQHLKKLGYSTRMVGKWHLGFSNRNETPTQRGFDSHYGYWSGAIDYFQYTSFDSAPYSEFVGAPSRLRNSTIIFNGKDIWDNFSPQLGTRGQYATDLFTNRALNIINTHDTKDPLFLYFAHLATHRGNPNLPVVAPEAYTRQYSYIQNTTRRNFAGCLTALDQSVGLVMQALLRRNMLSNSIVVFVSDNGAQTTSDFLTGGSNYPLREQKDTNFEGGIKVASIVWGPTLPRGVSNEMMHEVDWLPTLYSAAGGNTADLGKIDGLDQWSMISMNTQSPRKSFLINYDEIYDTSAYRDGNLKLVMGNYTYGGNGNTQWLMYTGRMTNPPPKPTDSTVLQVLRSLYGMPNLNFELNLPPINCGGPPPSVGGQCGDGISTTGACLFDISVDPCEYNNLATQRPDDVSRLSEEMLKTVNEGFTPSLNHMRDYAANPLDHCGYWDNWLDTQQSATFCRRG